MKMMVVKTQKPIPKYSKISCRKISRRLELPSPCATAGKEGLEFKVQDDEVAKGRRHQGHPPNNIVECSIHCSSS